MPVIITATDYSDIADKAVNYACQMALSYSASVTIIHSFIIPIAFGDTPIPAIPFEEGRRLAEDRMHEYVQQLRVLYPDLAITSDVMYGDIVDCLQEYTEQHTPWLVVLGNSEKEDSIWTGNIILHALRTLKYPVIAIPPGAVYRPVKKICLATDIRNIDQTFPYEHLLALVNTTKAALHVLNAGQGKEIHENTVMETEHLHMYLSEVHPQYHFIETNDIDAGINSFVEKSEMDWLVVIPHKHSFFEGLFHKSHTKAMARISNIPLIALHEKE